MRTAIWCERVLGTEVLSIGRAALAQEDCVMELVGAQLYYRVALRGGWIWVGAAGLDEGDLPPLFNIGDGPSGWVTLRRFIQALERSGITSLRERPVQIGEGADGWVIG